MACTTCAECRLQFDDKQRCVEIRQMQTKMREHPFVCCHARVEISPHGV